MRRGVCLLVFAAVSLAFAPAPLPRPAKKAKMAEILGEYEQVGSPQIKFVVTQTTMAYHNPGGHINSYNLVFDAGKSPRTYDIHRPPMLSFTGIYKVEGDILTICYRGGGGMRPTSFEEPNAFVERFKRLKR